MKRHDCNCTCYAIMTVLFSVIVGIIYGFLYNYGYFILSTKTLWIAFSVALLFLIGYLIYILLLATCKVCGPVCRCMVPLVAVNAFGTAITIGFVMLALATHLNPFALSAIVLTAFSAFALSLVLSSFFLVIYFLIRNGSHHPHPHPHPCDEEDE